MAKSPAPEVAPLPEAGGPHSLAQKVFLRAAAGRAAASAHASSVRSSQSVPCACGRPKSVCQTAAVFCLSAVGAQSASSVPVPLVPTATSAWRPETGRCACCAFCFHTNYTPCWRRTPEPEQSCRFPAAVDAGDCTDCTGSARPHAITPPPLTLLPPTPTLKPGRTASLTQSEHRHSNFGDCFQELASKRDCKVKESKPGLHSAHAAGVVLPSLANTNESRS